MVYMGIDTSCYTTSVAIVDEEESLVFDGRVLLEVTKGNRGLRQSEALFQHMRNLPDLIEAAMSKIQGMKLACITASSAPRTAENSYMPVFTAGQSIARIMASSTNTKLFQCSHQQNHITAGAWSLKLSLSKKYLVYHISGGTTELLLIDEAKGTSEVVGGTEDLNAGQFIDRVGVAMGMKFPCGKEMDKLCKDKLIEPTALPLFVKGSYLSFSGPESHVQRLLVKESKEDEAYKAMISRSVFNNIGTAISKTITCACQKYEVYDVLIVGGVASNSIIRELLLNSTMKAANINIGIAAANYSTDNAVGAALLGKRMVFGGLNEQYEGFYCQGNK